MFATAWEIFWKFKKLSEDEKKAILMLLDVLLKKK